MQVTNVEPLGFRDGSAVSFEVDEVPATHEEWSEAIGELALDDLFDVFWHEQMVPDPANGYSMVRRADGSRARDWWAGDHLWHVDGTRREHQPVYTVIGCLEAEPGSPGTELIDTAELYERTIADDFWERHDVVDVELADLKSVFVDSTYYREALPYMRSLAEPGDQALMDERIAQDLQKSGSSTLEEHADKDELEHFAKLFNFIRMGPLRGTLSLFFDGGGRNEQLVLPGAPLPRSNHYTKVLHELRWEYLAGEQPYKHGLLHTIGWAANRCLILPQIGTLHRALPGNNFDRVLHLGFLVEPNSVKAAA